MKANLAERELRGGTLGNSAQINVF